ncbi:hypothetical protein Q3O59_09000 [Alkalimonas delamerensis]|uniref:Uncharacterized protein n=1 Tax=Alkalimonas delamerensis TaxID=265981 RepID=A0ABT9GR79_9GAMM|nr:hypothetical protein [Alkalimonas delamerensis]MDP4529166.1 hypothetical protein [Alkalimonas delamerensis]
MEQRITHRWQWVGYAYPLAILGYLLLAWYTCYKVDFLQQPSALFPWSQALMDEGHTPMLWLVLFGEASLTENLQWFSLLLAAFFSGLVAVQSKQARLAAVILCFGLLWMYAEDCYNVRHLTSAWLGEAWLGYDTASLEWRRSRARTMIELAIYAGMAAAMAVAYWLVWSRKLLSRPAFIIFTSGYVLYGIAAFGSASRNVGDWYANLGSKLFDTLALKHDIPWRGHDIVHFQDPLGFWWMDYILEESLELMAASLLLTGIFFCIKRN